MSRNREIAEAFAAQFDPPLAVVRAERINNVAVPDAWLVAMFDDRRQMGVTAHVFDGRLHAYIEVLAPAEAAAAAGRVMAATMGRLKRQDECEHMAEGPQDTRLGAPEGHEEPAQARPAD